MFSVRRQSERGGGDLHREGAEGLHGHQLLGAARHQGVRRQGVLDAAGRGGLCLDLRLPRVRTARQRN